MKTTIIISNQDKASLNIEQELKKLTLPKNVSIHHVEESIYAENIDKTLNSDLIIFATKHQSQQERKTLSIHIPGNWDKAEFGGKPKKICPTIPSFFKTLFLNLNKNNDSNYELTTEQVHHGPYLETPVIFIEIGTTKTQWTDKLPAKIIAKTLIETLSKPYKTYKSILLLGGQHYNQKANNVLLETEYTISYICAKHSLPALNEDLLNQCIQKSKEPTEFILLDWKGLGSNKEHVKTLLESLNIGYKRSL